VLVLLRRRLAGQLDGGGDVVAAAMAALIRQFRDVDAQIRAIDARTAEEAAAADDDDSDLDDSDGWDPSKL
jgi:hypothetical protein